MTYLCNIADDAQNALIPKMILQPIVENAIIHGIEPSIKGGTVSIAGVCVENILLITVINSGIDFSLIIQCMD